MQVQKIDNRTSFKAGILFEVAQGMMAPKEIAEAEALAATIADGVIKIKIPCMHNPTPTNPTTYYPMHVLYHINGALDCFDSGQSKVLKPGETLPRPFEVVRGILANLAEKFPASKKS